MSDEYPPAKLPPVPSAPGFEDLSRGLQLLADVLGPHLVELTPEQRCALYRPTPEEVAFMDLLYEEMNEHPEMSLPGVDRERFMAAYGKRKMMSALRDQLQLLEDALDERILEVDPVSRFQAGDAVWSAMTHAPSAEAPKPAGDGATPDGAA